MLDALDRTAHKEDLKILLVPDPAAGIGLRVAAARHGRSLVNFEALTPSGLAAHIVKSLSPTSAGRITGRHTMELVLASHLSSVEGHEATTLLQSVSSLASSLLADREMGRTSTWARSHARSSSQQLYAHLFETWEVWLRDHRAMDPVDVLALALDRVADFVSERHLGVLAVCDECFLSPGQLRLMQRLHEVSGTGVRIGSTTGSLPDGYAEQELSGWPRATPLPGQGSSTPSVRKMASRREELLSVIGQILEEGIPFDDVEISYTQEELYRAQALALCDRLGIPVSSTVDPDADSKWMQDLLRYYLSCIQDGFSTASVAALMRSGLFAEGHETAGSRSRLNRMASDLVSLRLRPDRARSHHVRRAILRKAEQKWIPEERVHNLFGFLAGLEPFSVGSAIVPSDLISRFARFAAWVGGHTSGSRAIARLTTDLLGPWDSAEVGEVNTLWLAGRMRTLALSGRDRLFEQGDGVLLTHISQSGYGPRSHVFVVGLDDEASRSGTPEPDGHFLGISDSGEMANTALPARLSLPIKHHVA